MNASGGVDVKWTEHSLSVSTSSGNGQLLLAVASVYESKHNPSTSLQVHVSSLPVDLCYMTCGDKMLITETTHGRSQIAGIVVHEEEPQSLGIAGGWCTVSPLLALVLALDRGSLIQLHSLEAALHPSRPLSDTQPAKQKCSSWHSRQKLGATVTRIELAGPFDLEPPVSNVSTLSDISSSITIRLAEASQLLQDQHAWSFFGRLLHGTPVIKGQYIRIDWFGLTQLLIVNNLELKADEGKSMKVLSPAKMDMCLGWVEAGQTCVHFITGTNEYTLMAVRFSPTQWKSNSQQL
eukprot:SAG31_NODE_547_length_14228_cov_3.787105_10_plen_293_part_00